MSLSAAAEPHGENILVSSPPGVQADGGFQGGWLWVVFKVHTPEPSCQHAGCGNLSGGF